MHVSVNVCICAFILIHYNYRVWDKVCVRVGVCGRNTLNQTCHHPRANFFFILLVFLRMVMFNDVSGFVCVNVLPCTLAWAACVCMHVRACVCVYLVSVHGCRLSDVVSLIYFPSSLFTSQSDIHPAHIYPYLNRHIIIICMCVRVFTRYHVYLYMCLRSTIVNARVGRSLCARRRVYVGVYICDCLPACVWVNVCAAASMQSIAVLRLLSLWSSPHINASISTP